ALLGLLARQASDDHLLADLIPTLINIANNPIVPLAAENNALLSTLLERLTVQEAQTAKAQLIPTATPQPDSSQPLLAAIKAKDAAALYDYAKDSHVETSIRIRAIEALGQLHDPNIGTWLDALSKTPADDDMDIQKLAYKVLRRWQRAMTRAQQKRPQLPTVVAMRSIHTKATDKLQNQGEGHYHDQ
ncbi:MAG: hypothetical protein J6N72_06130, partial [Psychrobacter sp.]|nr:hypothetical protein [Psychrobacter sp.]